MDIDQKDSIAVMSLLSLLSNDCTCDLGMKVAQRNLWNEQAILSFFSKSYRQIKNTGSRQQL